MSELMLVTLVTVVGNGIFAGLIAVIVYLTRTRPEAKLFQASTYKAEVETHHLQQKQEDDCEHRLRLIKAEFEAYRIETNRKFNELYAQIGQLTARVSELTRQNERQAEVIELLKGKAA